MREPIPDCLQVMELRAFSRMHGAVERAEKITDIPDSPLLELYKRVKSAQLERIAERRRRG